MQKLRLIIFQVDGLGEETFKADFSVNALSDQTSEAMRQIKGRIGEILRFRAMSGQNMGLSLAKEVHLAFETEGHVLNTHDFVKATGLKVKLKIGNQAKRREKFFHTLEGLTGLMLRGDKRYTTAEVAQIMGELDEMYDGVKRVKLSTEIAEEAEVSAN